MSMNSLDPQEFRNIAGVGYIQGATKMYLDNHGLNHQVKVDGMYGVNTVHGLNWLSFHAFRTIAKESHLFQADSFNAQWENGIMSFQRWYGDIYEQLNKEVRKHYKLPYPENDGAWGTNTQAAFDAILNAFHMVMVVETRKAPTTSALS